MGRIPKHLTMRDLTVFSKIEMEGKTLDQTAEEMNISRDTVKRTKKRGSYRDLVLDALEEKKFGVPEYVDKLIKLTKAKKTLNCGGHDMEVEDNTTQMKAIEKIGKVYGDDSPTNIDITSSLASSRDEDLIGEIEAALGNGLDKDTGEQVVSASADRTE